MCGLPLKKGDPDSYVGEFVRDLFNLDAQELPGMVEEAVRGVPHVTSAKVEIVWDPPWDPSRMSEDAKLALNMY